MLLRQIKSRFRKAPWLEFDQMNILRSGTKKISFAVFDAYLSDRQVLVQCQATIRTRAHFNITVSGMVSPKYMYSVPHELLLSMHYVLERMRSVMYPHRLTCPYGKFTHSCSFPQFGLLSYAHVLLKQIILSWAV